MSSLRQAQGRLLRQALGRLLRSVQRAHQENLARAGTSRSYPHFYFAFNR
jgi:hypothetical protein